MSDSVLQKTQYQLRKKFREVYGKYGDANNIIFMEDHRPSSYRIKKSDKEETPMKKISFHALGLSEIFNEMHTKCEMKKLASLVNKDLKISMGDIIQIHGIILPKDNILDMGIYTRNRALRTIGAQKDGKSKGFRLSECSKHMLLENCLVNKFICDENKVYYKVPEEFRVVHEESFKHILKRMTPVLHRKEEVTQTTLETELDIKRYLEETFGDDVTVKYNGIHNNQHSYEARGHRHCPKCKENHVRNCAYINDIGGGNFSYNCRASTGGRRPKIDMNKFKGVEVEDTETSYLESFAHIRKKVISICGPMGCGKTYQIKRFLMQFPAGTRVLFVTCRKQMARSLGGRFEGFVVYIDKTNQELQIQEYESLHRIKESYDIIVMDELRSTLSSAACFETNGLNLTTNMDKLRDLCEDAQHVICADADLHIDGCVKDFYKHLFNNEDIHHINHPTGGQKLHHKFATEERFIRMIREDLKNGKKIMVCCGSSNELKALRKVALEILPECKIGIYHADSEKQNEIRDVSKYWPNYNFIGFTSTITVSIDYTEPIDRVYISPSSNSCNQRDMNQMKSRARYIVEKLVIVKYNPGIDGILEPLDVDLEALKNLEMNMVINRRRAMDTFKDAYEREFYGTIQKMGAGFKTKYFTTVLTDMWVWSRVEDYLKRKYWMRYFLTILQQKGYTWSCEVLGSDGENPGRFSEDLDDKKSEVKASSMALLESVDVTKMGKEEYKDVMMRKIRGTATPVDLARIQKYLVQQHYEEPVDAAFVTEFNKKKRAIYNQTFVNRFPEQVRRKIHYNVMLMKDSLDTVNADTLLIPEFQKTLVSMGFDSMEDSETKIDLKNMSEGAVESLKSTLQLTKTVKLERRVRSEEPLVQFKSHLEKIMGYKLKYHQIRKKGGPPSAYSIENIVPKKYIENTLYSPKWLDDHCTSVDIHTNKPVGTEMRYICDHMGSRGVKREPDSISVVPKRTLTSFWAGL